MEGREMGIWETQEEVGEQTNFSSSLDFFVSLSPATSGRSFLPLSYFLSLRFSAIAVKNRRDPHASENRSDVASVQRARSHALNTRTKSRAPAVAEDSPRAQSWACASPLPEGTCGSVELLSGGGASVVAQQKLTCSSGLQEGTCHPTSSAPRT